jgi:hypothetical protein
MTSFNEWRAKDSLGDCHHSLWLSNRVCYIVTVCATDAGEGTPQDGANQHGLVNLPKQMTHV